MFTVYEDLRGLDASWCIVVLIWEVHTLQGDRRTRWTSPTGLLHFGKEFPLLSPLQFSAVSCTLVWLNTWPCPSCSPPMSSYVLVLLFLSAFWFPLISCYGYHWLPFLRFLFSWLLSCRYVHRTSWCCCCFDWWRWSVPHARAIQYT